VAKQRTRTNRSEPSEVSGAASLPVLNSADVAVLAYRLWQARGCPDGSPEIDWHQAEQSLRDGPETDGNPVNYALLRRGTRA
jgi:hypothetical protein